MNYVQETIFCQLRKTFLKTRLPPWYASLRRPNIKRHHLQARISLANHIPLCGGPNRLDMVHKTFWRLVDLLNVEFEIYVA